jgi:hypothetical protein
MEFQNKKSGIGVYENKSQHFMNSMYPDVFTIIHACLHLLFNSTMFIYIEGKLKGMKGQSCMKGRGMGVYVH